MLSRRAAEPKVAGVKRSQKRKEKPEMRLTEDLRGRTKQYASKVIRLYVALPRKRREVEVLGHQLLRSGTSVAAHARESTRARSDSEFSAKLGVLLQEADESALWLELLKEDCEVDNAKIDHLLKETNELIAIFTTIISISKKERVGNFVSKI